MESKFVSLIVLSTLFSSVSVATEMHVELKNGIIDTFDVENVNEVYFQYEEPILDESETPLIFNVYSDYAAVVGVRDSSVTEIEIPAKIKIDGTVYNVEAINSDAFLNYHATSIFIPESVVYIGMMAFKGCDKLTTINIPSKVTVLRDETFYYCTSLKSLDLPEGFIRIGYKALANCSGLEEIHFPSTLTTINDYGLFGCTKLKKVELPANFNTLGEAAFSKCTSMEEYYVDSENTSFKSLDGVLYNYSSLVYISLDGVSYNYSSLVYFPAALTGDFTIPNNTTSIGSYAFSYSKLSNITIPESVGSISEYSFYQADSLISIIIPPHVESILYATFFSCDNLMSLEFPENLTYIGTQAFEGCRKLTSVTIPNSVTRLANASFRDCSNLDMKIENYEGGIELGENALFGIKSVTYSK